MGLPQSGGQSYEDALVRWLTDRDVLLVIDNCEHVAGEATFRLAPLSAEPAVQLFRERAGGRARGALDTESAKRACAEICRRVDGLPLAIELAAARMAGLAPDDIALHLDDLFNLLPQPVRRADGAQRSLRATVEWSDALLAEEERRLLRRMGAFAGAFDLDAIKHVCAEEGQTAAQVADLTGRLVEKSLLSKLDASGGYHCSKRSGSFPSPSSPPPANSTPSVNGMRGSTSSWR